MMYLLEPLLSSELILINNSKLLEKEPSLKNEEYLPRINELRKQFIKLSELSDTGETGLQKQKREVRDELRQISSYTYTLRDNELFGRMITAISHGVITRPQFSGYSFTGEMQSLAIQHILKYSHGFKPFKKSSITGQYISAFGYISTICFNAAVATINKFTREQNKAKEDWLEHSKLIHRDPNQSTYGPDHSDVTRTIKFIELAPGALISKIKQVTIHEETKFLIPVDYKITEKDHSFVLRYEYNISIERIKDNKTIKVSNETT